MTLSEQFGKLKDNWLIIVLLIVGLIFMSGGNMLFSGMSSSSYSLDKAYPQIGMEASSRYYDSSGSDFAPGVEERLITKTATLNSAVRLGEFESADTSLRSIVESSDAYLLKADVRENGDTSKTYSTGYYTLKVETGKYDSVISQLKGIAEVTLFTESQTDITARSTNLAIELETEQSKLARFAELYADSSSSNKVSLINSISEQERKISYLEEQLDNEQQKVSYSTVTVSLSEEQPNFWRVKLVTFMDLIELLVNSFNSLLYVIFALLPYALFIGIIRVIYVFFQKRRSK